MSRRILVIGGYGNFGQFISRRLAREADVQVLIAGRDLAKASALAATLTTTLPAPNPVLAVQLDIRSNFDVVLQQQQPFAVIHTSGPFQSQGYDVAEACIRRGCHYIDLADAREFVSGIHALDQAAKAGGVLVCSGASSVPTLTSAIIDRYIGEYSALHGADYAISTAQKTSRGLATTAAVLSYAGKPFTTLIAGEMQPVHGWLDLRLRNFFGLGQRLLGNCDIPDLDLFPRRYPSLRNLRFQAGLELKPVHCVLFGLSWLVRVGLLRSLQPLAPAMLNISRLLDPFGSDESGFYMALQGLDHNSQPHQIRFDLLARQGDGMYIPCVPSILMALKLARGQITHAGAQPCMGFISLEEYLELLGEFAVELRTVPAQDLTVK